MTHEYDNKSEKSRAVAAILCVFGVFGAHTGSMSAEM